MTQTYQVTVHYQGETRVVSVPADQTVLNAVLDAGWELPCSCFAGVCTTCAVKVLSGRIDQSEGAGIAPEVKEKGYSLICIGYPQSDLEIEAGKEDEVYELQFGV
jgi:ferredoxin